MTWMTKIYCLDCNHFIDKKLVWVTKYNPAIVILQIFGLQMFIWVTSNFPDFAFIISEISFFEISTRTMPNFCFVHMYICMYLDQFSALINVLEWRNRLARSAVNRKVGGSSPPLSDIFLPF